MAQRGVPSITATEGVTRTGVVGAFDPFTCANNCIATVRWGDGQSSTSSTLPGGAVGVTPNTGTAQTVTGSHAWAAKGSYSATVTINRQGTTAVDLSPVTVVDQLVALTPESLKVAAGTAFTGRVARFVDPGPTRPASVYHATIDWGDGATTDGSVTGSAGNFEVVACTPTRRRATARWR